MRDQLLRLLDRFVLRLRYKLEMNRIVKVFESGKESLVGSFDNVDILFLGDGNTIKFHESFVAKKKLELIVGSGCNVCIGANTNCGEARIELNATGCSLNVGKDVSLSNVKIISGGAPSCKIEIGDHVTFANDVSLMGGDGFSITDKKIGGIINKPRTGIHIGHHVNIGQEVLILKDAVIQDDCVIGARSVVTSSSKAQKYSILAGIPARVIRSNIEWVANSNEINLKSKESEQLNRMKTNLQIGKEDLMKKPIECSEDDFLRLLLEYNGQNRINFNTKDVVFEALFIPNSVCSRKLFVFFSAGGRSKPDTVFQSWSWSKSLDGDVLCLEDPTYKKLLSEESKRVVTGWYFGDDEISYLEILSKFILKIRSLVGYTDIVFCGTSAGAYASLWLADSIKGTSAIAVNPQIRISKWNQYKLYPEIHKCEASDKYGRFDLSRIKENLNSKFLILCNTGADDSEQIAYLNSGEIPKEGVSTVGNVMLMCLKSEYRPNHAIVYSEEDFVLFYLLLKYPIINLPKEARLLAASIIHEITVKYDRKAESESRNLLVMVLKRLRDQKFSYLDFHDTVRHVNVYFKDFGPALRYNVFIESHGHKRISYGLDVNLPVLNDQLREILVLIAKEHGLKISQSDRVFRIGTCAVGFEETVSKFFDLISNSKSRLLMCLNV